MAATKSTPINQLLNRVGKYLYKHIDGAYKKVQSANKYDIYMIVYYQVPIDKRDSSEETDEVQEMKININLATYSNKIRVNLTEITPEEFTIGSIIFPAEKLENPQEAMIKINQKVRKSLEKHYKEYDFIF